MLVVSRAHSLLCNHHFDVPMRVIFCFVLLAVAFAPLSAQKNSGSPQPQRIRVAKGESYQFATASEVENRVTMMGTEQISTISVAAKSMLNVVSSAKDSTVFALSTSNLEASMKGMAMMGVPDTTIRRDSLPESFEQATVLASGKLLRSTKDNESENSGSPEGRMLRQIMGSRSNAESMFISFPEKSLAVGDEWTDTKNDTTTGERSIITNLVMRYTFEGICDTLGMKCGRIKGRSERYVIGGSIKRMGSEMSMEGDGVVKSTYVFELKTGLPVAVNSSVELDQRLSVGEGMEIPISMTTNTRMTRVK